MTLRHFSDSDSPADVTMHIFLSEYSPTYVNVDERRARLRAQLVNSRGGPLGVIDVKEVVIGAVDVELARRLWRRLLDPTPSATHTWPIGPGPGRTPRAGQRELRSGPAHTRVIAAARKNVSSREATARE